MTENSFFPNHSDNDVVSFSSSTHKIGKFKSVLANVFRDNADVANTINRCLQATLGSPTYNWFEQGIDCELLGPGYQNWQQGKLRIRVTVEFEPLEPTVDQMTASDQPEASLDDIRRMINSNGQQENL